MASGVLEKRRSSVKAFEELCDYGPPRMPPSPTTSLKHISQVVKQLVVESKGTIKFVKNYFASNLIRRVYATSADALSKTKANPHFDDFWQDFDVAGEL